MNDIMNGYYKMNISFTIDSGTRKTAENEEMRTIKRKCNFLNKNIVI
jgi:hypothetical protein